jgi:hypothetical protein
VIRPDGRTGDYVSETTEECKARLRQTVEEILTRSELIPVIFVTTEKEKDFEDIVREYPEYITLACETPTQHSGPTYLVRLWVAHKHKAPETPA